MPDPAFSFAKLALVVALSMVGQATAGASMRVQTPAEHTGAASATCPPQEVVQDELRAASGAMQAGQYQVVMARLGPLASGNCDLRAHLLLAAAFEGAGELPRAAQVLQNAQQANPADGAIATSLARVALAMHQVPQAVAALAKFQPEASTPVQQMEICVLVYLAAHQLARAHTVAAMAYGAAPSLQTLLLFANTLQLEGRYKDVLTLMEKERANYPQSAPFLITVAESEFDAKIFDRAQADLERAVALDASRAQAHYLLGNVLFQTGDLDRAVAEYRAALSLAPDQPRTYYQLALALRAKQEDAAEQEVLKQLLAVDDRYAQAHCELGRLLLNKDEVATAVSELNAAIQINPSTEQAYYLLSKAYERLGDHARSDAMAKRLAEVRRENHQEEGGMGDRVPAQ